METKTEAKTEAKREVRVEGIELARRIQENIYRVFVGKEEVVEDLLVCLLAGGHVLLEDVPTWGKPHWHPRLPGVWNAASAEFSSRRLQFCSAKE